MRLPRQLFVVAGSAALIASIAAAGLSFSLVPSATATVGEPTPDPCAETYNGAGGAELVAFGENGPVCETPTEGPPKTHTPTPPSTTVPTEAPEVTNTAPAAPTTAPATNTPTGGAGAGGVAPPNTGSGGGASTQNQWLIAAGSVLLLAGGAGSVAYGLRRR